MTDTETRSISGRIWRGTAWTSGANILARIGTFLGNLAIIRLLGLDLTGQLGLIESWVGLITMFAVFGLNLAATKYVSQYLETDRERIGVITGTVLFWGGALAIGVCAAGYLLLLNLPSPGLAPDTIWSTVQITLGGYFWLVLALVMMTSLRQLVAGIVYGLHAFRVFVWINLAVGLVSFPLSYGLTARYALAGALGSRLSIGVFELILLAIALQGSLRRLAIRISIKNGFFHHTRQLFNFSLPTLLGQLVVNPVQTFMFSFLATQPNGLAQVGLITTGQRLSSLTAFLPGAMATTVMPILSTEWGRGDRASFQQGVLSALRMLWLSSLPGVVFFLAATPTLLSLLYGPEFVVATTVTATLLVMQLLIAINETGDRILAAAGRMWLSTANNLIWLVLFLGFALILIPQAQATGYVLAYLLSFTIYICVQLGWLRQLFQLPLRPLVPLVLGTTLLIVLAYLIMSFIPPPWQLLGAVLLAGGTLMVLWRFFLLEIERQAIGRYLNQINAVSSIWVRWRSGRQSSR